MTHILTRIPLCCSRTTSLIIDQIKDDIKEYNGVKFLTGLSIEFFDDESDGTQKFVLGQNHGEQCAVLDGSRLSEFYDKQTAYLQTWIEKFTNSSLCQTIFEHCEVMLMIYSFA